MKLLIILFSLGVFAQVEPPIKPDASPVEKEYLCGLAAYLNCLDSQRKCISPVAGTEEWQKALDCSKGFLNCQVAGFHSCEQEYGVSHNEYPKISINTGGL